MQKDVVGLSIVKNQLNLENHKKNIKVVNDEFTTTSDDLLTNLVFLDRYHCYFYYSKIPTRPASPIG